MLAEIPKVKQISGEPRRRWFASAELDLYLWYDDNDQLIQFQICYDKGPGEQALTWNRQRGLMHHSVDDGENRSFRMKSTPVMKDSSEFDPARIGGEFERLAGNMDYATVQFILSRIREA